MSKSKVWLAYILNFFIVGSGFVFVKKSGIGFIYLIAYAIAWAFHDSIGVIWAIAILVMSYIHLSKAIKEFS